VVEGCWLRVEGIKKKLFRYSTLNHQPQFDSQSSTNNQPTNNMFNFEKLEVWQEAINFADTVYTLTRTFPDGERFGLTNQMRRAAVSISSNLAEESSRSSRPDFARFVEIATGSVFEVVSQATISKRQGFLPETDFNRLYGACEKQSKMLSGLRKSLLEQQSS
jgi:four helix bundle protein